MFSRHRRPLLMGVVVVVPVLLTRNLWADVWLSGLPRSWDGVGHYGMASIYADAIYPDTFGWVSAYFGGMPFPNYYPPLFFWCVAGLSKTYLISFLTAFKLSISLPILLIPAALWELSFRVLRRDFMAATIASLASILFLVDIRSWTGGIPTGLDYYSTFQIGLYSQPLAFVLFILWAIAFLRIRAFLDRQFVSASFLLALTLLTNFFIAVAASFFIVGILVNDIFRLTRTTATNVRRKRGRMLSARLSSCLVASSLAAFWIVPMLSSSSYVVTRPYTFSITQSISTSALILYVVAGIGIVLLLQHSSSSARAYALGCASVVTGILVVYLAAPSWFPFQAPRFLNTLNLLLLMPAARAALFVGKRFTRAGEAIYDSEARVTTKSFAKRPYLILVFSFIIAIDLFVFVEPPKLIGAFYGRQRSNAVEEVLDFARTHRDGRYLVESDVASSDSKYDCRAISSYIGMQGNESITSSFHESSPMALFSLPLTNAFSELPDSMGISSILSDDLDFQEQPIAKHLNRAQVLGVRYLVLRSAEAKAGFEGEQDVALRLTSGGWAIYEILGDIEPRVRPLLFKPALVVSSFSLKQRGRNEQSFTRMVEEQFADGWFNVLLARSSVSQVDRLTHLEDFGSLILETYECENEDAAYDRLREFASHGNLILLSSEASLFKRIEANREAFNRLTIIVRSAALEPNEPILTAVATHHYRNSAIRKDWIAIREVLDTRKESIDPLISFTGEIMGKQIRIAPAQRIETTARTPVLIETTFHNNWRRTDSKPVYAVTPFFMLVFTNEPIELQFARGELDLIALVVSTTTLLGLLSAAAYFGLQQRRRRVGRLTS